MILLKSMVFLIFLISFSHEIAEENPKDGQGVVEVDLEEVTCDELETKKALNDSILKALELINKGSVMKKVDELLSETDENKSESVWIQSSDYMAMRRLIGFVQLKRKALKKPKLPTNRSAAFAQYNDLVKSNLTNLRKAYLPLERSFKFANRTLAANRLKEECKNSPPWLLVQVLEKLIDICFNDSRNVKESRCLYSAEFASSENKRASLERAVDDIMNSTRDLVFFARLCSSSEEDDKRANSTATTAYEIVRATWAIVERIFDNAWKTEMKREARKIVQSHLRNGSDLGTIANAVKKAMFKIGAVNKAYQVLVFGNTVFSSWSSFGNSESYFWESIQSHTFIVTRFNVYDSEGIRKAISFAEERLNLLKVVADENVSLENFAVGSGVKEHFRNTIVIRTTVSRNSTWRLNYALASFDFRRFTRCAPSRGAGAAGQSATNQLPIYPVENHHTRIIGKDNYVLRDGIPLISHTEFFLLL